MAFRVKHRSLLLFLLQISLLALQGKVEAVPGPPEAVTVAPLNRTAVLIQWKAPESPEAPVQGFQVEVLQESFKEVMFLMSSSVTVGPNVTELEIKGLKPFTGHVVRVAAYNKAGKRFSSEVFFTTAKNGKPEVQLYVLFTSSNQVLLKWSLLSRGNSAVKRYLIRYSLGAGSPWINQVTISPAVTFYLMRDLKSSTKYHVELLATNEHFTSEPSVVEASTQKSETDDKLPELPFPLPSRPSGFNYNAGQASAPVHLSAFLDLTCADSKAVWPLIKKLVDSYGPDKLRLTVNFFALAYFNNAFITLKSLYVVAKYNSSLVFPWVDRAFENLDYLNNVNTLRLNRIDIAEIIENMADKDGIPSSVMRIGLNDRKLEWQARLAWKYACSKGVLSTPTFFLNDMFLAGDVSAGWSEQQWKGIINKVL